MRPLVVFVVCVAAATANPLMLKKSMNAKAIDSVDQDLEVGQVNVDRSKKDVTFCVEVRSDNNKPMVVDCGNHQPVHFPAAPAQQPQPSAPSAPPAPAPEPEPLPEPQPQPQPQPQQNVHTIMYPIGPISPSNQYTIVSPYSPNGQLSPHVQFLPSGPVSPSGPLSPGSPGSSGTQVAPGTGLTGPHTTTLNIEVPCQQEMAAYVVQPPQELVLAPTGNCVPQIPSSLIQAAPANQAPGQVLHLPAGQHGLHGLSPHHHGSHGLHVKPVHHHAAPATVPASVPAASSGALPSSVPVHYHNGVQCTCNGAPGYFVAGRAADAETQAQSNEALAKKFLQDLQRNMMPKSAPAPAAPAMQPQYVASSPMISVQPQTLSVQPQAMTMQPQTLSVQPQAMTMQPQTLSVQPQAMTMQPQTLSVQPQAMTMQPQTLSVQPQAMTMQPQAMTMQPQVQLSIPQLQVPTASQLIYNSASRMKALEDSFASGRLIPGLRAYRDDGEQAAAAAAAAATAAAQQQDGIPEEAHKQSASEMMEKMKKNDKEDAKNPRVARFIMDKDDAENQLESN